MESFWYSFLLLVALYDVCLRWSAYCFTFKSTCHCLASSSVGELRLERAGTLPLSSRRVIVATGEDSFFPRPSNCWIVSVCVDVNIWMPISADLLTVVLAFSFIGPFPPMRIMAMAVDGQKWIQRPFTATKTPPLIQAKDSGVGGDQTSSSDDKFSIVWRTCYCYWAIVVAQEG